MGITVEETVDKVKECVESSTEYIDEKNRSKSKDIYEKEDWYHDVGARGNLGK